MAVSRINDTQADNLRIMSKLRLNFRSRAIANTDVQVVPEDDPPVQLITTSGTGPAVLRLPLSAPNGTVFWVANLIASTQALTVTDDGGSPATIDAIPTDAWVVCIKVGAAYQAIAEGTLTLA